MRKLDKPRFFANVGANDKNAYQRAIYLAELLVEQVAEASWVILLTPQKDGVKNGLFNGVLSPDEVGKLAKGGVKRGPQLPLLKHEALTTYSDSGKHAVVVTCGLSEEAVFEIEDMSDVVAIIAVPAFANALDKWARTWAPRDITDKEVALSPYAPLSCITEVALRHLTGFLEWSKPIASPREEEQAGMVFATLCEYEAPLDAEAVSAYLISKLNWRAKKAWEAEELINRIKNGGRRPKGSTPSQSRHAAWREECNQMATNSPVTPTSSPSAPAVPQ